MSVLDNIVIGLGKGRLGVGNLFSAAGGAETEELAESLLAFVGYAGPVGRVASALPHVDKRLIEIARALATRPSVLLLDEPAAGLGEDDTARLGALLRRIAGLGITVILVEHDMSLVMGVSDRVIVLDAGSKIADGEPAEVQRDPVVLRAYLGEEEDIDRSRSTPFAAKGENLLEIRDLSAGYGAAPVLRNLDLYIEDGELVCVLGANGAGKSTLMRALGGLHRPVDGSVLLVGKNIETLRAHRIAQDGLILVPEGRQVFPELSVVDNIQLGAFGRPSEDLDAAVERMLDRFPRLRERSRQKAGLLSGGEQQMLAIARGLVARPQVLMLDEPSLGLAPALINDLFGILAELRDEGVTILLVDQMAALALSIADRAYVLESGQFVRTGSVEELTEDPALAKAYLGGSQGSESAADGGAS